MDCKFCKKLCKNKNSLAQHEIRCKNNPDRIEFHTNAFDEYNKRISVHSNELILGECKYCKQIFLGQQTLGCHISNCIENPNYERNKKSRLTANKKRIWTAEKRKAHSDRMKIAMRKCVLNGNQRTPRPGGITRGTWFEKKDGTRCYLHGSWELKVAQFLEDHNVKWRGDKISFPYTYNGSTHQYYPDFYIFDLDLFIEVKGFETKKDHAKWSQFPKRLSIIRYQEFQDLESWWSKLV